MRLLRGLHGVLVRAVLRPVPGVRHGHRAAEVRLLLLPPGHHRPPLPAHLPAEGRGQEEIRHRGGSKYWYYDVMMILLTVAGQLLLRLSGRLLLHGVCPVPARGRDPGAGPQAAGHAATARHDATRDAAASDDAACDAAARHDGPADADDDATLKSQTFVAATALIMSYRVQSPSAFLQ